MTERFTESTVEDAALAWLESIDWRIAHGPEIAPDTPAAERADYGDVVQAQRLRDALARLNPRPARRGNRGRLPQTDAAGRGRPGPAKPRAAPPAGRRRYRRVPRRGRRDPRRAGAGARLRRRRQQ